MAEVMDQMRVEAPAAQDEIALLRSMKVGEVRRGDLMPGLPAYLHWKCVFIGGGGSTPLRWEFEGLFCDEPIGMLIIAITGDKIHATLTE